MRKFTVVLCILILSSLGFMFVSSCLRNDSDSGSSGELYLDAPSGLVVTAASAASITMSWVDNSEISVGFYIDHATPSVTFSTVATLTDTTTLTYTHTGLAANTTHFYRVRAYNYAKESEPSNIAGTLTSWDSTLANASAPSSRTNHTALWAPPYGLLIWGGQDGLNTVNTGAIYSPTADTWSDITLTGAPGSRTGHSATWTGEKMIIWGGYTVESSATQAIDDCETVWTAATDTVVAALDAVNYQEGSNSAKLTVGGAFATGLIASHDLASPMNISARTKVTFWVQASQNLNSGVLSFLIDDSAACVSPIEDLTINSTLNAGAWTLVTLNLANPSLLTEIASIGLKANSDPGDVIILIDKIESSGGGTTYYNNGCIYDPSGNSWSAISTNNTPDQRAFHSAVWTGTEMIIWGGKSNTNLKTGGVYDPELDVWRTGFVLDNLRNGTHANTPLARSKHLALWTGSGAESWHNKMIIWGGDSGGTAGGIYDIALDIWTVMTSTNAPSQRYGFSWVWTGEGAETYNKKIIVWGGYNGSAPLNDGATYDPDNNTWTALPALNAPSARMHHSGVWAGDKMFVWGGDGTSQTGGVYDPIYSAWGPMTTISAPSARLYHSGTWTGTEMIIWGGYNGVTFFKSGGIYKVEDIAP